MIFSQEFKKETYDGFAKSDRIGRSKTGEEEYRELLKELFGDNLGENSYVAAPISGACVSTMKIGKGTDIEFIVAVPFPWKYIYLFD